MRGTMTTNSNLTIDASSVLVRLLVYRMRNSDCHCKSLETHSVSMRCSRCRILDDAKLAFRAEFYAACELVTMTPSDR